MALRIWIVDDHALVREALGSLLAAQDGIDVVGATSGENQDVARIEAEAPDVVLLDIALAGSSGFELIPRIRARSPETRVLMLSMHAEAEFAETAIERGAQGLVSKAASVEELIGAIRSAAAGATLPVSGLLTPRERDVLDAITAGLRDDEIAERLAIRVKTVDGHCQRLMRKLGIHTRAGLVAYGQRLQSQQDLA